MQMPPVTLALLVANIAMFLLEMSGMGGALVASAALWPGERFAPWQLVTYSFLHGSMAHIFFNMLALYMFGSEIERLFGSRYYTAYYFASVVTAALTHLGMTSFMGGPAIPTVGASGGVFGVLLAFGMYFPHRRLMLLFPPIPMKARTFVILFGIVELVLGVTGTAQGVAHFAHLGGMLGGWLMIVYRRKIRF